jgi:hypothetical protein
VRAVTFGVEVDDFPAFGGVFVDAFNGAEQAVFVDGFVGGTAAGDEERGNGGEENILFHAKYLVGANDRCPFARPPSNGRLFNRKRYKERKA